MDKKTSYSENFKRKVVVEVLSGRLTKEQARQVFCIRSKSAILEWMRIFADQPRNSTGFDPTPLLEDMKKTNDDIEDLKAKVKHLEEQLQLSELKGRAYQIMVKIAKDDYGLDLEKKSGAKQFKSLKKNTPK